MASLQFRRNHASQSKGKKFNRASDTNLVTMNSSVKNYLNYFNNTKTNDKENQGHEQHTTTGLTPKIGLKKKQSEICFSKKTQNAFSLEKDKRTPFADRYGLRNMDSNVFNNNTASSLVMKQQETGKIGDKSYSIQKVEKKTYSVNKFQDTSSSIQYIQTECDGKNKKQGLYFIDCFTKRNKLMTEALMHIHMSMITFKTFKRACMFTKARAPDTKIPAETQGRKTIIFDMDQTLIHTNELITPGYEIKVPFRSINNRVIYGYVCVRPHAKEILKNLSQHFDVLVFTAGSQPYADPILDHIDPHRVIKHRLYRESCTLVDNQVFVKDLRIVGRPLQNVVLVDNAPHTYMLQMNNGIPILPYYKGKQDKQLYILEDYLMKLKNVDDVRKVNAETFQLEDYHKHESREKIVANLYSKHLN